ncbi:MAG: protein kinase [Polyangia bacterium]
MNRIGQSVEGYQIIRRVVEDERITTYAVAQGERRGQLKVLEGAGTVPAAVGERFLRSARLLQAVAHPALVRIQGTGALSDGCPYVLLENDEGQPLRALIAAQTLSYPAKLRILADLSAALVALHGAGLLYLNLRPDQVTARAGDPTATRAMLLDSVTVQRVAEGGPGMPTLGDAVVEDPFAAVHYLAPELFTGHSDVGPAVDVYGLGCLAYHLLAGRPPFTGQHTGELIAGHTGQAPEALQKLDPAVSEQVASLVAAMLAKEPARRPKMAVVADTIRKECERADRQPAVAPPPPPPRQSFGEFEVVRKLGSGGMGEVFEGVSARLERRVAIKVLHNKLTSDPAFAKNLLDEARATNRAGHPSIVNILQDGQTPDGRPYLVMEYLEGQSLRQRLEKGKLPLEAAISIGWQVALALASAHAHGVAHRDLKPENLFLQPDPTFGGGARCRILDFGIARIVERSALDAVERTPSGTPKYMAPEMQGEEATQASLVDVYALGCVLYEMIAGSLPSRRPRLRFPVPPRLARLVERMQSGHPKDRPSMQEVADQLGNLSASRSRLPAGRWIVAAGGLFLCLLGVSIKNCVDYKHVQKAEQARLCEAARNNIVELLTRATQERARRALDQECVSTESLRLRIKALRSGQQLTNGAPSAPEVFRSELRALLSETGEHLRAASANIGLAGSQYMTCYRKLMLLRADTLLLATSQENLDRRRTEQVQEDSELGRRLLEPQEEQRLTHVFRAWANQVLGEVSRQTGRYDEAVRRFADELSALRSELNDQNVQAQRGIQKSEQAKMEIAGYERDIRAVQLACVLSAARASCPPPPALPARAAAAVTQVAAVPAQPVQPDPCSPEQARRLPANPPNIGPGQTRTLGLSQAELEPFLRSCCPTLQPTEQAVRSRLDRCATPLRP